MATAKLTASLPSAQLGGHRHSPLATSAAIVCALTATGILLGTLDPALAAELPGFQGDVEALHALIGARGIDPGQLQQTLDAEQSPLAALPRQIVTAWYTGVVGEGGRARCITFETSLMHVIVADHLSPPSYCYGPYGSWVETPA